jgi:hypothetical protein
VNGTCVCEAAVFPPANTDLSPTVGIIRVDVMGVGIVDVKVWGETLLGWQNAHTDPGTGERSVQTEILSMDLSGSHPDIGDMKVHAGTAFGLSPTVGTILPLGPGSDFPANVKFDVFFEVDVVGIATLRNDDPLVMQAVINEIPPRNLGLLNAGPGQLIDIADPTHVETLEIGFHWMCPPPFPPPGVPCAIPCNANPFPVCEFGDCPPGTFCNPDATVGRCACEPSPPDCGQSPFPTCGGACPTGTACAPNPQTGVCHCEPEQQPLPILSEWGVVTALVLLISAGTLIIRRWHTAAT